jgi:hypothetical protein
VGVGVGQAKVFAHTEDDTPSSEKLSSNGLVVAPKSL